MEPSRLSADSPQGYFVQPVDHQPPHEPMPPTSVGCAVTPLIDAAEYTAALGNALERVGQGQNPQANAGQCVLVAGWWLGLSRGRFQLAPTTRRSVLGSRSVAFTDGPPFCLDPWPNPDVTPFEDSPDETTALLTILKAKARAGVDVRVLGWVSPPVMRYSRLARMLGAAHIVAINTLTLRSIQALRAEPAIGGRALPNLAGHVAGSSHSKIALICDGENTIGFTGGLDCEISRWARPDHFGKQIWHDVAARVEGPVVQTIYDHFKTMWDANLSRPACRFRIDGDDLMSVLPETPPLPPRVLPVLPSRGRHQVQGLQTLPTTRPASLNWLPKSVPLLGVPEGLFTYRAALRKAIAAAQDYVYIEDQFCWSQEIMRWLNQALRDRPVLRVLLLLSGVDDPHDPPLPHEAYLCQAINHGLLVGLSVEEQTRVAAFQRTDVVMHAKTVLIDDAWAVIGSCNIAQRSLYTDIEHGVSFIDPEGDLIRQYRARLWTHHFRHGNPADFADLSAALNVWQSGWGHPGPVRDRPKWLQPLQLPVKEVPLTSGKRFIYQALHDPDSRRRWGGLLPPSLR
jgi:phosphatidylserine/phosphatidylglycerophosphate/cardiolipin synthase-like enzyme